MIGDFHFLRPAWLLALVPLVWLAILWLRVLPLRNPWVGIVDPPLLRRLAIGQEKGEARRLPFHLVTAGWVLTALALAGPTWSRLPAVKFRSDTPPLVIALDLSRSMDTQDVMPSRLGLARLKLDAFLERLPPREVGLVAFAGTAHAVMPPTEDMALIRSLLPFLETALMPVQGTAAGAALDVAWSQIRANGNREGEVLLVSDGSDGAAEAAAVARRLGGEGLRVSVLGVGTAAGGLIPLPEGNALVHDGRPVETRLDATALRTVAQAGGGAFAIAGAGDADLAALVPPARFIAVGEGGREESRPEATVWKDRGPWLVLLLLPLAALAFRRGWLGAAVLAGWTAAAPAQAFEWSDLWRNDDQKGLAAMHRGDVVAAERLFRDPFWRAVALYRLQDFQGAAALFGRQDSAAAHYNRGNALVQMDRWEEAVAAYDAALRRDPALEAAATNREIVLSGLKARAERVPPASVLPGNAMPAMGREGEAKPYLEDFLAEKGGDRQLKDIEGRTPETGVRAVMGGGAILGGNEENREGETGPGTGQASRKAGFGGKDEDSVRRPGTRPGEAPSAGEAPPDDAKVPPADDRFAPPPADMSKEGLAARTLGKAVGAPADGRTRRPETGGEPEEDKSLLQDHEPLSGGTQGERMEEQVKDERLADPTDAGRKMAPEMRQSMEQWLARISDDPGGLLREKFRRDAERSRASGAAGRPW
ncbi:MAG: VWA domain-containing protein [Magnetospirillum sp. WYHS-4]